MGSRPACVDDAFGYALVVEVRDFLPEDEVLHESRSPQAGFQGILIVGDTHALVGGEFSLTGVDPRPVQRKVAGIKAGLRLAGTDLGAGVTFRKSAAGCRGIGRSDRAPRPWFAGCLAVLAGLVFVVGHARGQRLRRLVVP